MSNPQKNIRRKSQNSYTSPCRDHKSTLFQKLVEMARADGSIAEIEALLDYIHPESGDDTCLTDYRFDIVPKLIFGSSEGIYLMIYLEGSFDSTSSRSARIGTIKTLDTSVDACRLMGALGGILMYYGRRYVNQEIHRYTPQPELIGEAENMRGYEETAQFGCRRVSFGCSCLQETFERSEAAGSKVQTSGR